MMPVRALVLTIAIFAGCGGPEVVSWYGSYIGANHKLRIGQHPGIDFVGSRGDPILAAMEGQVIDVSSSPDSSGNCVVLRHLVEDPGIQMRFTLYCHLDRATAHVGQLVTRGAKIGEMGATGKGSGGIVHLHFQLCTQPCTAASEDGDLDSTLDPVAYMAGCFDPLRAYDPDTLQLTYPVRC